MPLAQQIAPLFRITAAAQRVEKSADRQDHLRLWGGSLLL